MRMERRRDREEAQEESRRDLASGLELETPVIGIDGVVGSMGVGGGVRTAAAPLQ